MNRDPGFFNERAGRINLGLLMMLIVAVCAVSLLIPSVRARVMSLFGEQKSADTGRFVLHPVNYGPFRIEITEDGKIDSVRSATLSSSVKGTTTIISLVPEGSLVSGPTVTEMDGIVTLLDSPSSSTQRLKVTSEDGVEEEFEVAVGGFTQVLVTDGQKVKSGDYLAGDVVCELDSSTLVESELSQQIKVTGARASLEKAEKNLEIQRTTNEKFNAAAKLAEKLASLDLRKYTAEGGEYDQSLDTVQGEIKQNEEELAIAQEEYERVRELARKGYTSLYNLEAARIKVTQKRILLNVKRGELQVLKEFTKERTESELLQMAEDTKGDVIRAQLEGEAAMAQMEADYEAAELTLEVEVETLDRLQRQIADCRLVAPQDGEVVYATQSSRRSEPIVIEPGAQVRERQTIVKLPNLEQMKVDARIHESRIRQVQVGQLVEISVSSLPGLEFHGILDSVASLPVPGDWPNNNQMEFESVVTITDSPEMIAQLKPGMGTELRIIVEEREDPVLQVPVQSIIPIGESFFAYVQSDDGPQRRSLVVGKSNDEFMEILDGLAEGEQVILNPRTHFSPEISRLEQELAADAESEGASPDRPARPARRDGGGERRERKRPVS